MQNSRWYTLSGQDIKKLTKTYGGFGMKNFRRFSFILVLGLIVAAMGFGQLTASHSITIDIANVAVMGITAGAVTLTINNPATAGALPESAEDTSKTLAYTSIIPASGAANHRHITVELSAGLTTGIALQVGAAVNATGGGTGSIKNVTDATAVTLITSISSVATSVSGGATDITYKAVVTDISGLDQSMTDTVNVIYTIEDGPGA